MCINGNENEVGTEWSDARSKKVQYIYLIEIMSQHSN